MHLNSEECRDIPLFCVLVSRTHILLSHRAKKIFIMGGASVDELYAEMGHPFFTINLGGAFRLRPFLFVKSWDLGKLFSWDRIWHIMETLPMQEVK